MYFQSNRLFVAEWIDDSPPDAPTTAQASTIARWWQDANEQQKFGD